MDLINQEYKNVYLLFIFILSQSTCLIKFYFVLILPGVEQISFIAGSRGYHRVSCSEYKAEKGKRREGVTSRGMAFVFPSSCYKWWSLAFLGMAEQLPAHAKWWMNSLFWFAWMCSFALAVRLSLSHPQVLLLLVFWLCPIPLSEKWESSCGTWLLAALNHDTFWTDILKMG